MMGFVDGHANVQSGKHGENECLDIGNQTFKNADEYTKHNRNHGDSSPNSHRQRVADNEDDDHKAQDNNVAGSHVGK